jgi:Peptidase family M28
MKRFHFLFAAVIVLFASVARAQYTPWLYWTFLPKAQMDEIVGEASGEAAWRTIAAINAFNRDRTAEEFKGTFFETQYIVGELKRYGIEKVDVVSYPGGEAWDGIKGELWEVSPIRQKLASHTDMVPMLANGSSPTQLTGELLWVGRGTPEEIRLAQVEGKIVVTEGNISSVHAEACLRQGALGVIAISQGRPKSDTLEIPWSSLGARRRPPIPGLAPAQPAAAEPQPTPPPPKFGFNLPLREGEFLKDRLLRGEKITVAVDIETQTLPYDLENVVCVIPGTDPGSGEVIFSAHLFEGIIKQGANDNMSGSAAILEVARTLQTLISDGRLPRPKRSIRFIWGPEFAGISLWVKDNMAIMEKTLCNINLDMVGEWLSKCQAHMCLMRTTYGNPHYINDVMENYYRYVGEGSRERIQNRSNVYPVPRRIVSPFGADEPFNYSIETHYGASDHEVFNDWGVGVPGVMMIAWPDPWYHLSGDLADKSDSTQLKRTVAIGAAAAYTVASADDNMAVRIAAETAGNATRRLGHQFMVGLEELNSAQAESLAESFKSARGYVEAALINERETLDSILELAVDRQKVGAFIARMKKTVEAVAFAHLAALQAHMETVAARLGTKPAVLVLSDLEKQTAKIVPRPTSKVKAEGFRGYLKYIDEVPKEEKAKFPYSEFGPMDFMGSTAELHCLIDGAHSILDIKKMLDAQSERKANLQHIVNYIQVLKLAGLVEFQEMK